MTNFSNYTGKLIFKLSAYEDVYPKSAKKSHNSSEKLESEGTMDTKKVEAYNNTENNKLAFGPNGENTIFVQLIEDEGIVWIATENSSGAEYKCKSKDDLLLAFAEYVENYVM